MNIHDFYYNDSNRILHIEFSLKTDSDNTYRVQELVFEDIQMFSPTIIHERDMLDIDNDFISELLIEYFKDNDLPEEELL